jgi:hypothetical protein
MKAQAILWQKLYACFSKYTVDQVTRVLVPRVATDLDIRDRVSMKTGRLSHVPNRQFSAARAIRICALVPLSQVTKSQP